MSTIVTHIHDQILSEYNTLRAHGLAHNEPMWMKPTALFMHPETLSWLKQEQDSPRTMAYREDGYYVLGLRIYLHRDIPPGSFSLGRMVEVEMTAVPE